MERSEFVRAGEFDFSPPPLPPLDAREQALLWLSAVSGGIDGVQQSFDSLRDKMRTLSNLILAFSHVSPPESSSEPAPSSTATAGRRVPTRRTKGTAASESAEFVSGRIGRKGTVVTETRSIGSNKTWRTRKAAKAYEDAHPGVSHREAVRIVKAQQAAEEAAANPPSSTAQVIKLRGTARKRGGRKSWETRKDKVVEEYAAKGEKITREQAHQILVDRQGFGKGRRKKRTAVAKVTKPAARNIRPARRPVRANARRPVRANARRTPTRRKVA